MEGLWLGSWLRFIAGTRLGPYVPTPHHVCSAMLALAAVTKTDTVADVGCGDGRLLLAAAQRHGARGVGYELDARLAAAAEQAVAAAGFSERISIRRQDARHACFADADVVTMYLSERGNAEMLPLLRAAAATRKQRGAAPARAVTFTFPVPGLQPVDSTRVDGIDLFLFHLKHMD